MCRKLLIRTAVLIAVAFAAVAGLSGAGAERVALLKQREHKTFSRIARSPLMQLSKPAAWKKAVPGVKTVTIRSSADGAAQPALFYDSGSKRKKPLLLVLHSWSADYQQHFSIPYGVWAVRNDWVFIHPDYRGAFTNPTATASELAVQDILDALRYAKEHAAIDESRIYIAGFSGGGMATLIMAGRYPHLWTAAVAWVPVYDLAAWYLTTRKSAHDYSKYIESSCGGPPLPGADAEKECLKRSPRSYLHNARGKVPVYIATGISDPFVPPDHALKAFNDLAAAEDRLSEADIEYIARRHRLPSSLSGTFRDRLYADAGVELLFERRSGEVTLKIFKGGHDVVYNAGLHWLSQQRSKRLKPL